MYVCMHACMHACMYACMHAGRKVGRYVFVCVFVFVFVCHMYHICECIYVYVYIYIDTTVRVYAMYRNVLYLLYSTLMSCAVMIQDILRSYGSTNHPG